MTIANNYIVLAIQRVRTGSHNEHNSSGQNHDRQTAEIEFEKILEKEEKKLEKMLTNSIIDVII